MEYVRLLLCALSVFVALVSERFMVAAFSQSLDSDFTFTLPAGHKECFYQTMKKDASLEIEYQVIKSLSFHIFLHESETLSERVYHSYLWMQSQHLHTINVILVIPTNSCLDRSGCPLLYVLILFHRQLSHSTTILKELGGYMEF